MASMGRAVGRTPTSRAVVYNARRGAHCSLCGQVITRARTAEK